MDRHPFFSNILLHTNDELAELGLDVRARETLHEWPLSCVQWLELGDGRRVIYKSQLPPTVEPLFYDQARSPLLIGHRTLGTYGDCTTMVFDWIDAPLLHNLVHDEREFVEQGKRVVAQIGAIAGDLPVVVDIGSTDRWKAAVERTLTQQRTLIEDGCFHATTLDHVTEVMHWATNAEVLATITAAPRVIHGDLTADQVFVTEDGFRVIDWQRPAVAPPDVDLVALCVRQHIDPRQYVDAATVGIYWLLHLRWAVQAQYELFPNTAWPLFDRWAADAVSQILRA